MGSVMNYLSSANEDRRCVSTLRRSAWGLGRGALVSLLVVSLGACGDSSGDDVGNSDSAGTESGADSTDASASESGSDSDSGSPSGSGSDSGATNEGPGGGESDGDSTSTGGSSGGTTVDETTGSTTSMISTGSSATETTGGSTGGTTGMMVDMGPPPVVCSELDDQQDCLDEPECVPAMAEHFILTPALVCKEEGEFFKACVSLDDCVAPSDDLYCMEDEINSWWDLLGTCVPDGYMICDDIPGQDSYPICL